MGEPLVDLSAEGVSRSLCLCHSTCKRPGCEPGCEHNGACWKDVDVEAVISCGQDDLVVEEIGMALTEVMHACDDDEEGEGPGLDEDFEDDDDDPVLSLESDSTDGKVDVDSGVLISPTFPSGDASESSISKSFDGNFSNNDTPRLVSAMKGTRAKQGIMTKLSVSWAPDVYDPPITSNSHTVRGHQRSSRKGQQKYKSSSNRSTSGSKKEKKHSRHSSSSSSSSSSKKDRRHSYRSSSSTSSSRTDTSGSHYRKAYSGGGISSGRPVTCVHESTKSYESTKSSPLVLAESATLPEMVPVLKTTAEPIKCATSCGKEKPFALLSRQFSPARYKGMFSFWSQNQLAS